MKERVAVAAASLLVADDASVSSATPVSAFGTNFMKYQPSSGWCYQVNPPVDPNGAYYCQWDYTLHDLYSGMWYTGCGTWGPDIY